ncbi:hypothetical protein ACHAXR_011723 [Thalassiosira sp. AJA248-18]
MTDDLNRRVPTSSDATSGGERSAAADADACDGRRSSASTPPKNIHHTELTPSNASAAVESDSAESTTASGNNCDMDHNNTTTTTTAALRHRLGRQLSNVTDVINDNLIVVRYATISTVLLLGVYGIANTPLFYRYKHITDIPTKMFFRRKWIHGRIVGVVESEGSATAGGMSIEASNWNTTHSPPSNNDAKSSKNGLASLLSTSLQRATTGANGNGNDDSSNSTTTGATKPIVVLFRHSSPMERLLTQSAMDKVLSFTGKSPSRLLYSSASPYRNLLPIELAGVSAPPPLQTSSLLSASLTDDTSANQFPLLNQLIQQKAKVSLQLLAQRTTDTNLASNQHDNLEQNKTEGRKLPEDNEIKNTAICHLHYRQPKQWLTTTNASLEMVKKGQAWMNSCGMVVPLSNLFEGDDSPPNNENNTTIITDFDPTVKQLQNDTEFISQLEIAEYSSWSSKSGMWSSNHVRQLLRKEYEEEHLENKSGIWNLMKRGWEWIRRR